MKKQNSTQGYKTTSSERASYWGYFFGQNVIYAIIAFNVQTFYSDIGITATTVAAIMLLTKVWDAVNDPLIGILIDRIRFKKGRFMPWIRIAMPLLTLSSILLFALPITASPTMKVIWAVVAYAAWDMSYTLCDVPMFVLPTTMTDNIVERTNLLATGRFVAMIGLFGAMTALPIMQARLGWFVSGLFFSIIGGLTMLPLLFKGKERQIVRPEKDVTLKQMFKYVAGNKYLLVYYISMFIGGVTNFSTTVTIFFARHNLGNQDAAALLTMLGFIPTVIIGAVVPSLIKRIDKFYIFVFAQIALVITGLIRFFIGYENLGLFYALTILNGIFMGIYSILIFMFTPDCLEYGTYHTGERAEGIAASIQTFFSKLQGGITGPIAMLILAATGFGCYHAFR